MELKKMFEKAKEIKALYGELNQKLGQKKWGLAEYTQGFIGDVGDLVKLIMAKNGFRDYDDVDEKLKHELADCLWSLFVIADELGIDLEETYVTEMEKLHKRVTRELNS